MHIIKSTRQLSEQRNDVAQAGIKLKLLRIIYWKYNTFMTIITYYCHKGIALKVCIISENLFMIQISGTVLLVLFCSDFRQVIFDNIAMHTSQQGNFQNKMIDVTA